MYKTKISNKGFGFCCLLLIIVVTGCVVQPEPTFTPLPPTATFTASPTFTETPTPTVAIPPTLTLKPSWTPHPTRTPKPTETPMTTPGPDVTCSDCINLDGFHCSIGILVTYIANQDDITSCRKVEQFIRFWAGADYELNNYRDTEWLTYAIQAYLDKLDLFASVEVSEPLGVYGQLMELSDEDTASMAVVQLPDDLHAIVFAGFTEEDGFVFLDPAWNDYWNPPTQTDFAEAYGHEFEDVWLVTYTIRRESE